MIPPAELAGGSWERAFDKELRILHWMCGSRFFFNTYRQELQALGGSTLDRIHYDEEPPQAIRNESRMRTVRRDGDEIFTMTPVEGMTWTADEFWEPLEQHRVAPDVHEMTLYDEDFDATITVSAVTVDMDDNPTLTGAAKAAVLSGLSQEERQARKSGKFVALHGTIYPEFAKQRFVIPEMETLPDPINVIVGIDPGFRHAAAVLWGYVTPTDLMVIFHEGYYKGMNVAQVSKEIHAVNAYYNVQPAYYVMDPASRNKEHITGRSVQMAYADHQIVAIAGQNDVRAGINAVKERLEMELDEENPGGFQITANCDNLIRELVKYRWKKPSRVMEGDPKEAPVKKDDHAADALRYLVMSRPYLPALDEQNTETELEEAMRLQRERGSKRGHIARVGT
jgi:phage terminase large subunit-like protein